MATRRSRRRPGENRARLLEAGIVEFSHRGYHGASTAAIAVRAEVPQPHVYVHFTSKLELFSECVVMAAARLQLDRADSDQSPGDFGRLTRPDSVRLLMQAVVSLRDDELRAELTPHIAVLRDELTVTQWEALLTEGLSELLG